MDFQCRLYDKEKSILLVIKRVDNATQINIDGKITHNLKKQVLAILSSMVQHE